MILFLNLRPGFPSVLLKINFIINMKAQSLGRNGDILALYIAFLRSHGSEIGSRSLEKLGPWEFLKLF